MKAIYAAAAVIAVLLSCVDGRVGSMYLGENKEVIIANGMCTDSNIGFGSVKSFIVRDVCHNCSGYVYLCSEKPEI